MKIALISIQDNPVIREEAGIGIIAAVLRNAGHNVIIVVTDMWKNNIETVLEFKPDAIGISAYLHNKDVLLSLSCLLKEVLPNAFIFAGGYLPTYYHNEILKESDCIDVVVLGEGENTVTRLIDALGNEFINRHKCLLMNSWTMYSIGLMIF